MNQDEEKIIESLYPLQMKGMFITVRQLAVEKESQITELRVRFFLSHFIVNNIKEKEITFGNH